LAEELIEPTIGVFAIEQCLQSPIHLDTAVLADAQENNAVDRALNREVEIALRELRIAHGQIAREIGPPLFDLTEKGVVHLGSAALGLGRFGKLIEGAFEDRVAGKDFGNVIPTRDVFVEVEIKHTRDGSFVVESRLDAAIVNGEFFEIGQDAQRKLG
jgi:hypothetical protein